MRWFWRPSRLFWGVLPLSLLMLVLNLGDRPRIEDELAVRANAALQAQGQGWATPVFEGRDAVLTGSAPSEDAQSRAVAIVEDLEGVRTVRDDAGLLALAEPFTWSASRDENRLKLKGHVPNEKLRGDVLSIARAQLASFQVNDQMALARGAPDVDDWLGGISFGLKQLDDLAEGGVSLTDTTFSISGTAASPEAYARLRTAFDAGLPGGLSVGSFEVSPATVEPYAWGGAFDGSQLRLTGYAPSEDARSALLAAVEAALPSADLLDTMQIAAGAPDGWVTTTVAAVTQLGRLNSGQAGFDDSGFQFSGTAQQERVARSVETALLDGLPDGLTTTAALDFIDPDLPTPSPYPFAVTADSDTVRLSGYVPNPGLRDALTALATKRFAGRSVINELEIGRGAPVGFGRVARLSVRELAATNAGTISLSDRILTMSGEAQTEDGRDTLVRALRERLPGSFSSDLNVGFIEPRIPTISPYTFGADFGDGGLNLSGYVPSEDVRAAILAAAGDALPGVSIGDGLELGLGAPSDFASLVRSGLGALGGLNRGRFGLSDQTSSLSGEAQTEDGRDAVLLALREALGTDGDTLAADLGFIEARIPEVSPYRFGVEARDGRVRLSGHVPDRATRAGVRGAVRNAYPGFAIDDDLTLARGAPGSDGGFGAFARAMVQSTSLLQNGAAALDGETLSLSGDADDAQVREDAIALLGRNAPLGLEVVTRGIRVPEPVVEPEPEPEPEVPDVAVVEPVAPQPPPFSFFAVREGDVLTLSGGMPDNETLNSVLLLAARKMPDARIADELVVVENAPEGLSSIASEVVRALSDMPDGVGLITVDTVRLIGEVTDDAAGVRINEAIAASLGAGQTFDAAITVPEVTIPVLSPYTWSAAKGPDGIALSGGVPDQPTRDRLVDKARGQLVGGRVTDQMELASGAPAGFGELTSGALDGLTQLDAGTIALGGTELTVTGRTPSADAQAELDRIIGAALPDGVTYAPSVFVQARANSQASAPVDVDAVMNAGEDVDEGVCQSLLDTLLNLGTVNFEVDQSDLTPESFPTLVRLGYASELCPTAQITIEGHTDSDGSDDYNQGLSERRAKTVVGFLTEQGVQADRLEAIGFGEARPLAPNTTSEGKARNRRIEFSVRVE